MIFTNYTGRFHMSQATIDYICTELRWRRDLEYLIIEAVGLSVYDHVIHTSSVLLSCLRILYMTHYLR